MSLRDRIDINKNILPNSFDYTIGSEDVTIEVYYQEMYDSFYINLYDSTGAPLITGEKLVYGMPLWNINDARLPMQTIIPMDESGKENTITWDNFNSTVFLYVDDLDPELTDPNYVPNVDDSGDLTDDDLGNNSDDDASDDSSNVYGDADDYGITGDE